MNKREATDIIRDLAHQDDADSEADIYPSRGGLATIHGWRHAAGNAGDSRVVQAIDLLGETAATYEYVYYRRCLSSGEAVPR